MMEESGEATKPHPRYHVLAIVSFVLSLTGYAFLPLAGSVGAIVTGKMALKDMEMHPGVYRGELLARLAVWFGWLAIVLAAAILVFMLVLINLAGSFT